MSIASVVQRRNIKQVLHFTTNKGVLGVLVTGALKARARLAKTKQLEYILKLNAAFRKDEAWLDYVNLSITRINSSFFEISSEKWHKNQDLWWAVLAFDPEILSHDGVYFVTTNNIYTGLKRGMGEAALEKLFAPQVARWNGNIAVRSNVAELSEPTCQQAEVLYPREVPIAFLRHIYVRTESEADEVGGQLALTGRSEIPVEISADKFK